MTDTSTTEVCPTCGTRISEGASKCLVCGTDLRKNGGTQPNEASVVQSSRMPTVTLNLPVALGLLALFLGIGAGSVFFLVRQEPTIAVPPTETPTPTVTTTPTLTATPETPTPTNTPEPSPTPLSYIVQDGDLCTSIAFAFDVSVQSIILLNNLDANCTLFVGQSLLIPQPTPTPTPFPTATLNPTEAFAAECDQVSYEVQEGDTLSTISANYQVPIEAIKSWNGLVGDSVFSGQQLLIPLCERELVGGPTPTPTPAPPYPAPNLLLPVDGAQFTLADDVITLQWASVGVLRENEVYMVIIEDITAGEGERIVDYVVDTKYIVPEELRPTSGQPHLFRWWVGTARQSGTDEDGLPVYEEAGALSAPRGFIWTGAAGTPAP